MKTSPMRLLGIVSGVLVLASILACGSIRQAAGRVQRVNDLQQLAMSYHNFINSHNRGPKDHQEWLNAEKDPQTRALIQRAGPGGEFVFYYGGLKIATDFPKGTGQTILGYDTQTASGTRVVAFGDGSVKLVTEAEFKAAPRPGPEKK